jgi:hypothetical protein
MRTTLLCAALLVAGNVLAIDDNTVEIAFNGNSATVTVASNISSYITNNSSGSHVKLVQAATFQGNKVGEITYLLKGSSTDGEFYLEGSYKCTVALNGLTLTNPSGPAINIQNGKRIDVSVKSGTTNTLTDGPNDDYNGCFHSKGHTEFKGKGTLNIVGRSRHGIYSKEYMELKNCTVNITAAPKDGIHCKEYFLMESGTITISGVEDDGIQVEQDDKIAATGQTTGHEDENSGNFYMEDGKLNIAVLDYGGKHVKADGTITYGGGTHTFTTTATAIHSPLTTQHSLLPAYQGIYDLNGVRRTTPRRGLNIINGKKVMLK